MLTLLGPLPTRSDKAVVKARSLAGVGVLRLNFSHSTTDDPRAKFAVLHKLEKETGRLIGCLADLQDPKLRLVLESV